MRVLVLAFWAGEIGSHLLERDMDKLKVTWRTMPKMERNSKQCLGRYDGRN